MRPTIITKTLNSFNMIPNITTRPVLARFAPLDSNPYGYEMRWVQIIKRPTYIYKGKDKTQGRLKIWCAPINPFDTRDFPTLKPLNKCGRKAYIEQALRLLRNAGQLQRSQNLF